MEYQSEKHQQAHEDPSKSATLKKEREKLNSIMYGTIFEEQSVSDARLGGRVTPRLFPDGTVLGRDADRVSSAPQRTKSLSAGLQGAQEQASSPSRGRETVVVDDGDGGSLLLLPVAPSTIPTADREKRRGSADNLKPDWHVILGRERGLIVIRIGPVSHVGSAESMSSLFIVGGKIQMSYVSCPMHTAMSDTQKSVHIPEMRSVLSGHAHIALDRIIQEN